jgi:hypothetical protein
VKAKGDDLPKQPRRQTIVQATGGADSERIAMVTPRSQNIGRANEMDPMDDAELGDEMHVTKGRRRSPKVRDDMSPEAGLWHTPVNTSPRRFDNDGANGLSNGVWGKLQLQEVRVFPAGSCSREELSCLTAYARNVFMLQQVFGEKVLEEMSISIIIDFCHNELGVFSSEVGPSPRAIVSSLVDPFSSPRNPPLNPLDNPL